MFYISPNSRALEDSSWEITSKDDQTLLRYGWSHSQLKPNPLIMQLLHRRKKENIKERRTTSQSSYKECVRKSFLSCSKQTTLPLSPILSGLEMFSVWVDLIFWKPLFWQWSLHSHGFGLNALDPNWNALDRHCPWAMMDSRSHLPMVSSSVTSPYWRPRGWGFPEIALNLLWDFQSPEIIGTPPGAVIWKERPGITSKIPSC